MTSRHRRYGLGVAAAVLISLTACGSGEPDAEPPAAATSTTAAAPSAECTQVSEAYAKWNYLPQEAAVFVALDAAQLQGIGQDGGTFSEVVKAQPSQAAKDLNVAVTTLNLDVAVGAAEAQVNGRMSLETALGLVDRVASVRAAYDTWRSAVCG